MLLSLGGLSRQRENYVGTLELRWSARLEQTLSVWLCGLSGPSGSLMQPNKPDRPNRPNEQDRLADCFSILSERIYLKMPLGKVTVPGWIARSLTGYRRVPIMLHSSVSVLRQGVIACRLHLSSHRTSRENVNMDSVSE